MGLVYASTELVTAVPFEGNPRSLVLGSVIDRKSGELRELEVRSAELVNTLEYMVWPDQREQLLVELYSNLKRQSNLKPLDAWLWVQILSVQVEHEVARGDRVWALESAIRLNKWNEQRRPVLARHCLLSEHLLAAQLLERCLRLYTQLPWQDRPAYLSRSVGVSQSTLTAALERARKIKAKDRKAPKRTT